MLTVVIIMTIGIAAGYGVKKFLPVVKVNDKLTTWAIYLLLFLMGIGIGANKTIMGSLHNLGLNALIISIGGVLGSISMGWVTYRLFFKNSQK